VVDSRVGWSGFFAHRLHQGICFAWALKRCPHYIVNALIPGGHKKRAHPTGWAYSTFHRYVEQEQYPLNWTAFPSRFVDGERGWGFCEIERAQYAIDALRIASYRVAYLYSARLSQVGWAGFFAHRLHQGICFAWALKRCPHYIVNALIPRGHKKRAHPTGLI
jgi:hypothetical protein